MLSLALPFRTWAHRLPAGAKFGALAVLMIGAAMLTAPAPLLAALAVLVAAYASLGRSGLAAGARALRPVLWIAGFLALWQIWLGTPREALVLGLRICLMVGLANFVTLTTPLPEIVDLVERLARPLARFGISPRLPALSVALVLRFVPVLRDRFDLIGLSWRARARKRAGPRLLVPLTLSLLDDSEHLAEAIRARGGLNPPRPTGRD